MQFKVKDIGDDGLDVDVPITASWLARECGDAGVAVAPSGVGFSGRIEPSGSDYLLRGSLSGGFVTACARCLEPATLPLDVEISVVYVEDQGGGGGGGGKTKGKDDDEDEEGVDAPDVIRFSDGLIDLGSELREEILLALPVSVLCREDCAGLCPVCGGNRNASPCDCEERQRQKQSKFATLAKLKS
jgi:uncharacterized protein